MSTVEVAGLAGTWVAAGLAFLGIFGIVGPLLVWSASRSKRHKALMSIGLKNNGYLSRGLTVWPGIRFFQIKHVPSLKKVQLFTADEWRDFDLSRLKSIPESTATWIQFGACLEAYDLKIRRGKELASVETEEAGLLLYLPVHRAYLFTFLVMGRYQRNSVRVNTNVPGTSEKTAYVALPAGSQAYWDRYPRQGGIVLHGLTGSFNFLRRESAPGINGVVSFVTNLDHCPSTLAADNLSWSSMAFLALGFLPLPSDHYLCFATTGNEGVLDTSGATHLLDKNSGSVVEAVTSPQKVIEEEAYRTDFEVQVRIDQKNLEKFRLEVYSLQKVKVGKTDLPLKLSGPNQDLWIRLLQIVNSEESVTIQGHLQELAAMTFVPPKEEYVRVSTLSAQDSSVMESEYSDGDRVQHCVFITRASAQLFALGLLTLPWSQKNYIVGRVSDSNIVRNLLFQAAPACIRFLLRLKKIPSILHLSQKETAEFLAAADNVLQNDGDVPRLCELDEVLSRIQHEIPEVSLMIGVLVLTNTEYRELIYQSVRHAKSDISNLPKADTELNFDTGHVRIPGPFGIEHVFVVDLNCLLEDLPSHQRSQIRTMKVDFAKVLLASLKAYMRSQMLQNCIDGSDIEEVMGFSEDVYHVM